MILATDVAYNESADTALAAGVVFPTWTSSEPAAEYAVSVHGIAPYVPGSFYLRELPCLRLLLAHVTEAIHTVVVDGYVERTTTALLGRHLYDALDGNVAVVGVAKSPYDGAEPVLVYRGRSANPLYVTAVGMTIDAAAEAIRTMHGAYRMPTLLRRVDAISRGR